MFGGCCFAMGSVLLLCGVIVLSLLFVVLFKRVSSVCYCVLTCVVCVCCVVVCCIVVWYGCVSGCVAFVLVCVFDLNCVAACVHVCVFVLRCCVCSLIVCVIVSYCLLCVYCLLCLLLFL